MSLKYLHHPNIESLNESPEIIWDSVKLPIPIDKFDTQTPGNYYPQPGEFSFWLTLNSGLSMMEARKILMAGKVETIRITTSKYKDCEDIYLHIKKIKSQLGVRKTSIALDISGPKVRISNLELLAGKNQLNIIRSDQVAFIPDTALDVIATTPEMKNAKIIPYRPTISLNSNGEYIFVSDGWAQFEIVSHKDGIYYCLALNDTILYNHRGIDILGSYDVYDAFDTNREYINKLQATRILEEVDWLCISFCNHRNDIERIKSLPFVADLRIMAKIETKAGLDNINEIISVSDGIMVARGDLAVELSIYSIDMLLAEDKIRKECEIMQRKCVIATRIGDSLDGHKDNLSPSEISRLKHELFSFKNTVLALTNEVHENAYAHKNVLIILKAIEDFSE
jgi:pyruvate kinase